MHRGAMSYARADIPALPGNGLIVQTHVIERWIGDARAGRLGWNPGLDRSVNGGDAGNFAVPHLSWQQRQAPAYDDQHREPDRDHTQQQF